jgi:hypothetical protein
MMRVRTSILILAALLTGCTHATMMHNAQTGQTTQCGGGLWTLNSTAQHERCLAWFHQLGFEPVP